MQGEYQARHPRMRSYINAAQDLIKCFEESRFNLIPQQQNCIVDSLATYVFVFNIPMHPNRKYEVEDRHRPSVPDNVKSWKVFEDDKQIHNFLTLTGEFEGLTIDENDIIQEGPTLTQEWLQSQIVSPKEIPWDEYVVPVESDDGGETKEACGL